MIELIEDLEQRLNVPMPEWLRTIYLHCNGFSGPFNEGILYPPDGEGGVRDFTLFLREQDYSPSWIQRAIVFGYVAGSGSITTHSAALDGKLIEWCYADGEKYRALDGDLFNLWERIQSNWDNSTENDQRNETNR